MDYIRTIVDEEIYCDHCHEVIYDEVFQLDNIQYCHDCFFNDSEFAKSLTFDNAMEFGESHKVTVEIELNGFLAELYKQDLAEVVNDFLSADGRKYHEQSDATDFIQEYAYDNDDDWCEEMV